MVVCKQGEYVVVSSL